ncbi:MAG: tetratricopeptide repeat protein [Spirochaetes bacterium]|nr:tetratricopeptide repeat protein [Spirochaetota bacterium]
MKKILLLMICHLLISLNLLSQPVTVIQQSAENTAAGDTGVSYYAGVGSIYYNTATLCFEERSLLDIQFLYNKLNLYNQYSIGYLESLRKNLVMALDFVIYDPEDFTLRSADDNYQEKIGKLSHVVNMAVSSKLFKELNYGFNLKMINNSYGDESYLAAGVDFGMLYLPGEFHNQLSVGINFVNFISSSGKLNNEEITEPMNIKFGAGYNLNLEDHLIFLGLEGNSDSDYYSQYGVGLKYTYKNIINLNLGYNEKLKFTAGAGFYSDPYKINYSYSRDDKNDNIFHRVSITFYFRLKLDEDTMERYYNKAIRHYNDFKFAQSFEIFKDLYRADKDYRETAYYYELLRRRIKEKEEETSQLRELAEDFYDKALDAYNNKQYSQARGFLIECLKINVKHRDARSLLSKVHALQQEEEIREEASVRKKEGDYYFSLKQYASALVEYNQALKLDPDNEVLELKIRKTTEQLGKENRSSLGYKLYKEGKNYFEAGEYTKAISKWEEAVIALPNFTLAKVEIEKARRMQQEREEADAVNRMREDQVGNLFKVAEHQFKNNQLVDALFQAESILEIDPRNQKAQSLKQNVLQKIKIEESRNKREKAQKERFHLNEGIKAFKENQLEQALFHFGKVIAYNPAQSASIKELADVSRKIAELERQGINRDSANYRLIKNHYERGMQFFSQKNFDQAIAEWKRVLKIVPENYQAASIIADADAAARKEKEERLAQFHLDRAMRFLSEGKQDLARAEAKRILAILPDHAQAKDIITKSVRGVDKKKAIIDYLNKGEELFKDEKYPEAIQELRMAIAIDPNNSLAKKRLGEYEEKLKEIESEKQVENSLDMASKYLDHENYTMARKYINQVLAKDTENPAAKELLNKIEEKEVDIQVTEQEKLKLVEIFNTGLNKFLDQDYDECIKNMRKVLLIDPDNIQALKFIEKAKAKIKETQKQAIEPSSKHIDKKLVWTHYLKGINYYTSGDLDSAIKEWREALRIDPGNEKIRRSLNKALVKKEMLQ